MPCHRPVTPGFTRCSLHGAHNVTAKLKAEQMLAQARLPACEALFDIIDSWQRDVCPTCEFPKSDVDTSKMIIRAAQVILDRSGVGPRAVLEVVKQTDGDLDLDLLTNDEMARLDYLLGEVKTLKENIRLRLATLPGMNMLPATSDTVQ